MPWVRIHDGALRNFKIAALSDKAFRLWVAGLAHAQEHLTDGEILKEHLRGLTVRVTSSALNELTTACPGKDAPLWETTDRGYRIHDFLEWNDSREKILSDRAHIKRRNELYSNPELLHEIRRRDGDRCRYCGRAVKWSNKRGPDGATFDHIVPRGPNTIENVVVACRGCNSAKGRRIPEECGMRLMEPHGIVKSESNRNQIQTNPTTTTTTTPRTSTPSLKNREGERASAPAPSDLQAVWNAHRGALPEAMRLSSDRARHAKARLLEHGDLGWWAVVVQRMAASAFCRGEVGRKGWRADFDFFLRPGTAERVLEGKYDAAAMKASRQAPISPREASEALVVRREAGGCPHSPVCGEVEECLARIAHERRAKRGEAA